MVEFMEQMGNENLAIITGFVMVMLVFYMRKNNDK